MRTNEQIRQVIEVAFQPLHCGVEIFDYDKKIKFQVFDLSNQSVHAVPDLLLASIRDDKKLRAMLEQARATVIGKGYVLAPWSLS
jgi:hypothetical protein